jgi:two-component sensor histidine kinase
MSGIEIIIAFFIILAGGIAFFAALYQFSHSQDAIAMWSGFVMLSISINLFCYIFLKMNLLLGMGRFVVFLQVVSYLLLDISYLVFVIYFIGRSKWISKWTMLALVSVPLLIIALMIYHWHSLPTSIAAAWSSFGIDNRLTQSTDIESAISLVFTLFVVYSTCIGLLSLILLISMYGNTPPHYRKTVLGVFLGNVIITTAGMVEIFGVNLSSQVSILQFAVALAVIPIFLIVFNWKDIRSIPINHTLLNNTIRDGYLIVDPYHKVVDFNLTMSTILASHAKIKTGCLLSEIIPDSELSLQNSINEQSENAIPQLFESQGNIYQVNLIPIEGGRKEFIGTLVVFQNVSERDMLEENLLKQRQSIVQTNALLSGLAEANLNIQKTTDITSVYQILSTELERINLSCFVLNFDPTSSTLVIQHVSSHAEKITRIEKILGFQVIGYPLDRRTFPQIYSYLKRSAKDCSTTTFRIDQTLGGDVSARRMEQAFHVVGIELDTPVTVLQLSTGEKILGLLGIWGKELGQHELAPLRIFASQVAWAIARIDSYNDEVRRSTALARSNQMITALTNVTTQVGTTDDSSKALETLGQALENLNLHCLMGMVDAQGETVTFKYASFYNRIRGITDKIPGFQFIDYQLPKKLWPGTKVINDGIPVWYHNPIKIFSKMFPMMTENLFTQALKRIGVSPHDNLCILPLIIEGRVSGILAVWGSSIQEGDTSTLMVFAHQVAENLRKTKIYEDELSRANNLNRTNKMIVALSNVAAHIETTTNLAEVFNTLSAELEKVDLSCLVCTLDDAKQDLVVEYGSLVEFKDWTTGIGRSIDGNLHIPTELCPAAIFDKKPVWAPDMGDISAKMQPLRLDNIFGKRDKKLGTNLNAPACFLPMIVEEDVIGLLAVRGPRLTKDDIPGLSVFANQVATAIKNTTLYNQAQQEILSRRQAEANLQEALNEKEILLKEIHHRVKNNLQVISSLLSLQIRRSHDMNTNEGLRDSQNRVRAMALIHEKLYQSDDLAQINFSAYLRSLTSYLAQTYRVMSENVSIEVEADQIMLDLDTAVPCGLIVNELVTNSLKYAYPDGEAGRIRISCRRTDYGQYSLVVGDDGPGLPVGFDLNTNTSLGLKLVSNLVKQIEGQMKVNWHHGAQFEIQF